jgi:NAD(P)H dehydrogenase (quinone)
VRLRKVHELAPDEAIGANAGWAIHAAEAQYVAEATAEDILWATR